jgi:Tfp pilus assembly protein PilF
MELKVRDSQAAAARGDATAAQNDAVDAHKLEPWAATPYLQLALLYEQAGQIAGANRAIDAATARDPSNWQLWLVASRLQVKGGCGRGGSKHRSRAGSRSALAAAPAGR